MGLISAIVHVGEVETWSFRCQRVLKVWFDNSGEGHKQECFLGGWYSHYRCFV